MNSNPADYSWLIFVEDRRGHIIYMTSERWEHAPLLLEGLMKIPTALQSTILKLLQRAPLSGFLQVVEIPTQAPTTSRLQEVFVPAILQSVAAG